jgi:hypothetical protein
MIYYAARVSPINGLWYLLRLEAGSAGEKKIAVISYGPTEEDRLVCQEVADLLNKHIEREWS